MEIAMTMFKSLTFDFARDNGLRTSVVHQGQPEIAAPKFGSRQPPRTKRYLAAAFGHIYRALAASKIRRLQRELALRGKSYRYQDYFDNAANR
jgi:hypothetical protein